MSLTTGSIAFVGFNADGLDGLALVAVDSIPAGAVLRFSDNEWNGLSIGGGGAFNTGEGGFTWTNGATALAAGTVVEFLNISVVATRSASVGTLGGGVIAAAAAAESVFVFEGTSESSPTQFLTAVTNNNGGFNGATSGLLAGTGLVAGSTALVLPGTGGADVAAYLPVNGTVFASRTEALNAFNNGANWIAQDGAGNQDADGISPDAPFLTSPQSPISGVVFSIGLPAAGPSLVSLTVDQASRPEGEAFTFTATLSAAAASDTVVNLTASGATDDIGPVPASITIPAGQASASVVVTATQDAVAELDEAFTLTASLGADIRQATATILNDDAPASTVLGGITILDMAASLQGSVATPVASNSVNVTRIGGFLTGDGAGGAESIAFDAGTDRAYVTNSAQNRIDIYSLAVPSTPILVGNINLPGTLPGFAYGGVNSVAVRGDLVAVAVQNQDGGENGVVALYSGEAGTLVKTITVGALPDNLTFSPDGSLLIVGNEGERFRASADAPVEDVPGTVTVISVPADPALAVVRNTIGYTALNGFEAELDALGIKTYDGGTVDGVVVPDPTVSQDLEPEYIAVSPDGTKAYVTLQEANAVAVIDLTDSGAVAPVSLLPLGFVDFSLPGNEADFSDRDGPGNTASISVGNAPVKSLLQPDAIASFEVGGTTYFITANEGDTRIVGGPAAELALNEARASAVQAGAPADYARLNVDTVWSTSTELYGFGGRGFSIFRQNADDTIVKVEETGGDIEQIIAAIPNAASVFNGQDGGLFDTRSDNKGTEPEGVTVGTVDGLTYAFVTLERIGGLMVWDVSNPEDAKFVRYLAPTSEDYGPEVATFVSAADSPNGRALVLTANEVSGSVTVYEISNLTRISAVQGSGTTSPLVGQIVTVEAIVVGDFQNGDADTARNLGGFWLQEEMVDQDGNAVTSEGIFIAAGNLPTDVQIGDRVRVTGTVAEAFNNTEITASAITVVQAGAVADVNAMAAVIDLPTIGVQGSNGAYRADLEAFEGMLVTFPQTLTVTEQFNLDQFGEIRLTQGERPNSYTVSNEPSVSGYDVHLRDIASRSVIFDDGRGVSNPDLDNVVTDGDYNSATAPRMGDQVTGLTGVLDYDFSQFRVHAIESGVGINDFVTANPRPAAPEDVGGTLKVASFNVLNFFTTLDNGALTANGFDPRGAETTAELARQTEKLINVILALDADVLGLMELENNFAEGASGNAIEYLVAQLNAVSDTEYDWVRPGQNFVGGDAIAVGFIYDSGTVRLSPGTAVSILDDSDVAPELLAESTLGAIFNGANTSRAVLAATFEEIASGEDFTAVVNHFKSKGGSGTGADAEMRDGNGGWNLQRTLAAEAILDWIELDPTGSGDADFLILGDLNAYAMEDPIDVLVDAGYTDQGAGSYGYVFDGQTGSLDHMLTNAALSAQVTGVTDWHINADEADALDYQLNFNADLTTNERDPAYFDANVLARVSDHDPLIIGLDLRDGLVEEEVFTLQLLHFSDGEAGLLAGSTAKYLTAMVDAFEDDYANTLILAGGDTYLPGPFLAAGTDPSVIPTLNAVSGSTISLTGTLPIGAVDTAIHNAIGVEVSAIGNHEWDLGSNTFAASIAPGGGWVGAEYALVSANLDFSGDAAINPRFTNTVGNGATPTPLASTLAGRIAPSVVVEKDGERIGIVGATTQILEAISSPTGTEVKGFPTGPGANGEVDDMVLLAAQLQPVIDELRAEGINKIILQAHLQNIANEQLLATLLSGVDIILAAGSNTRLGDADDVAVAFPGHAANFAGTYPLQVTDKDGNTTLIVNTDNEYTYLGRLKVDFDADGNIIVDNLAEDVAINGAYASTAENAAAAWGTTVANLDTTAFADGTKGDDVERLTDAVQAVIAVKDGNVFGFTDVYLEGERAFVRSEETNLGSLSADANAHALRQAIDAPAESVIVSFKNGGGIRAQIGTLSPPDPLDGSVDKLPPPANPDAGKLEGGISQLDIENSLRFDNKLMAFDTTAQGLKAILEHGVAAGTLQGRFPQIGGVAFSWDPDLPAGSRVSDIALLDGNGEIAYALYDDGVLQAGVPASITVVTLNFLANGGDGYPAKANGANFRYLLTDGSLSAPVDEALDFTASAVIAANTPPGSALLGEQQALGAYLQEFHATPDAAFDIADTPVSLDERIQNLNFRADTVLEDFDAGPEIVANSLVPALAADALGAVLGTDDLAGSAIEGAPLGYTLTSLPAGLLLVRGEIATIGTRFTQAEVDAGLVTLLAGAVTPERPGNALSDGFGFALSNGSRPVSGTFSAGYESFDTVQTAPQRGAYTGLGADDYQLGTAGNDIMSGAGGSNMLLGQGGDDTLSGGNATNRLFGGDGNDALTGGNGADLIDGGDGRDTLDGRNGDNILIGGLGDDRITAGNGENRVFAGGGNDVIDVKNGRNLIDAGAGDDRITSGNGDDVIIAGTGNDVVFANGGNNLFKLGGIAGATDDGDDRYTGGNGVDRFALFLDDRNGDAAGWGDDVIEGFSIKQGDQLIAFNAAAGFWDDPTQLLALAQSDFITGRRSGDGADLTLTFAGGSAEESSVLLRRFFEENSKLLTEAERGTGNGAEISDQNLAGILLDVIQDGGNFGVSGPDFLAQAHNLLGDPFML